MKIDVLTLFPEVIKGALGESIVKRACDKGILQIEYYDIRDYSGNRQNKVDDTPYGGGPGMLMACGPVVSCHRAAVGAAASSGIAGKPYTVYMSPKGRRFDSAVAKELSQKPYLVLLCGHYEGVDQRALDEICDDEISIGDYVLTGGELASAVVVDAVARFIPGVLGAPDSAGDESFEGLLLEYPQYTKPAVFEGKEVPAVLTGGNHDEIGRWRKAEAEKLTERLRPDLFEKYRESVFCRDRVIYFDNSATTRQLDSVTRKVKETAEYFYGNPSSLNRLGLRAENVLKSARETAADSINAGRNEIIFTASGSEADNLALKGFFRANRRAARKMIISAVEHPAIEETAKALEAEGVVVRRCPVDSGGVVKLPELINMIEQDTALISIMMVNNETGAVMPIREIAELKNRINPNIVLHTDCVQSYGKLKIDVEDLGADMLTVSGHKIHGPRGAAFLYARRGLKLAPLVCGGGQEMGLRSGTENLPAIAGFAEAISRILPKTEESYGNVRRARDLLLALLIERYGDKIRINTDTERSIPYVLNVSFAPLRAEVLLHALESRNVFVSTGSACSSHKKNRSPVLTAMGIPDNMIDGSIRISFSYDVTEDDVRLGFERICESVKELKRARR